MKLTTRRTATIGIVLGLLALPASGAEGREYHVAVTGDDGANGSREHPLRTVSAAAARAQPGDTVTVHAGTYRERVTPPRGGASDRQRITYQAAPGERVVIKGSEEVTGWQKAEHDTWKVTIANDFFGDFNPYSDLIRGDWFDPKGREHHTGAVYLDEHWLTEAASLEEALAPAGQTPLWFARVDPDQTTIWAQFEGVDPNDGQVEINVRQSVFYPAEPGVNYITVRGFTMMHAATPWAPPTAEQIGLIGTRWSKGWIIEQNDIRYSTCVGITLGKYGDQWDNTSEDTAVGYVKTIERALENGWSKENIGHHVVRDNEIAHCEQAGIVGSLGAIFSRIIGNDIHDIHMRRLFTGAEMGGIKIHAAVDTEIRGNHIYRTHRGIWLDWMAQGARVTRNLLHDNDGTQDLFFEVNHGPFMVDHNICLSVYPPRGESHWQSRNSVLDVSQGGAYAHNLFANGVRFHDELTRDTPYLEPHGTGVAGLKNIPGGDNRFDGNVLVHHGLDTYDEAGMPSRMNGNVFLSGAQPSPSDESPVRRPDFDPGLELIEKPDGVYLKVTVEKAWAEQAPRPLVTTDLLGKTKVPDLPYLDPDRMPYRLDTDYLGAKRNPDNPFPGPFERPEGGSQVLKVWPVESPHHDKAYLLWPDGAPQAKGSEDVDRPQLTVHFPEPGRGSGAAVIVNPGGGYRILAADHEGLQVARWLNRQGIAAFVLRYRLEPKYEQDVALLDAQRAVRYVRHRARDFGISPTRVGMLGFSAGGHLTAAAGTNFDGGDPAAEDPIERLSSRPDFLVPIYPAISPDLFKRESTWSALETRVTSDTPPTFLVHTHQDGLVVPEHSIRFYQALHRAGVPAELHVFTYGPHGTGLAPGDPELSQWQPLLVAWLRRSALLTDRPRAAVSGEVIVDSEPLFWGWLTFVPEDEALPTAVAYLDWNAKGTYELPAEAGPCPGRYRVEVHRVSTDFSAKQTGAYSMEDAERLVMDGTIEIEPGSNRIGVEVTSR